MTWPSALRLTPFLRSYTRWVVRHPRVVIALTLLVTAVFSLQLGNLQINYDPDDALPSDHPLIVSNQQIHDTFGGDLTALCLQVRAGDIFNPATLSALQRITREVGAIPGVVSSNLLSIASPHVKDMAATAEGMAVQAMMPSVPATADALAELKQRVYRDPATQDLLVSRDGSMACIISDYQSMKKVGGASRLIQRLEAIAEKEASPAWTFHLAGVTVLLHWMDRYSERVKLLFPLAVLVVGLLHYHAFRTLQGLIIPLLTALFSVVWALGILGWCRANLDPYNVMTPILVLAVAAGHSVQILKRYYEEYQRLGDNQEAIVEATSRVGVAMLAAGFVAAMGMASLVTFHAASIRNFGLFSAFGILSALVLELSFIPALRALLQPPSGEQTRHEQTRTLFDRLLDRFQAWILAGQGPRLLLAAGLLLAAASLGAGRLVIDNSFASYFPESSRVMRDLRAINAKLAGTYTFALQVEGSGPDALQDPAVLAEMEAIQAFMNTLPGAGKTVSLVDVLKRMNQVMHDDDPRYYALPASRELVAQYLLLYSLSGDSSDFDRLVDYSYRRGVILMYAKESRYKIAQHMIGEIDKFLAGHVKIPGLKFSYGGGMVAELAGSEAVIHGKLLNILQVSVMVFLISSLVFLSFTAGLLVLMPLALTVWVNFGFMGASGIWLNMATASISAVALGMGADYGIYFLFRFREELIKGAGWEEAFAAAEKTSGKAILYVATAITLGYACLMLSGFSIHVYIGIMMSITMILSSLSALTLLPALLFMLKPKFLTKHLCTGGRV